jgi:hypothetical protein
MKIILEKLLSLYTEIKYKYFGKKKNITKDTENTTNTGLDTPPDILSKIEEVLFKDSFRIDNYKDCGFYFSNGYWYKSNGKGDFVYLGKDFNFKGENNYTA